MAISAEAAALLDEITAPAAPFPVQQAFLEIAYAPADTVDPEVLRSWPIQDWELSLEATEAPATHDVRKLRHSHHEAARMLAAGAREMQIASALGYSPATIYLLKKSPTFMQLVQFYEFQRNESAVDFAPRMDAVLGDGLDLLGDRVRAETIDNKDLVRLVSTLASRRGYPEVTKGETRSVSMTLSATEIEEIKQGARSWQSRPEQSQATEILPSNDTLEPPTPTDGTPSQS